MKRKKFRVMVVDDDHDILDLIAYNLSKEGFKVKSVAESADALRAARKFQPDLIILDIMMPHPNGIELCRELRKTSDFVHTPIFFLTARSEPYFKQAALDTGGDEFIEKVMGLRALTQKVKHVLSHDIVIQKGFRELKFGPLTLHRSTRTATWHEQSLALSEPEFEILYFFMQNPKLELTARELMDLLWGSEYYFPEGSIDTHIENLNRKAGLILIERTADFRYRLIRLKE
ncbi:MAG: response regulator transcription factor [Cyclobacteriaceae bacterium]|nr:response regulator transcription factor [Cyclobacteriaceae bacterium]MDW8332066.1 response regulator transcription factor [Cyclobacteriaceae bacterium]